MSIRPLISKPFTEVKNLELSYLDNSLSYTNSSYSTTESFNFSLYNALENFNDITINNYSYFFLGKKEIYSNWIKGTSKINETAGYVTGISFKANDTELHLTFDINNISATPDLLQTWDTGYILNQTKTNNKDTLFVIDYIEDTNKCYIKHTHGSSDFYLYNRKFNPRGNNLTGEPTDDLWFTTNPEAYNEFSQFNFIKNGNSILIFLSKNNFVKVKLFNNEEIWCSLQYNLIKALNNQYILSVPTDKPAKFLYYIQPDYVGTLCNIIDYGAVDSISVIPNTKLLRLVSNKDLLPIVTVDNETYVTISTITDNKVEFSDYINTSWLSYKDQNKASINVDKSEYDIESQCLFHLQYNNIKDNNGSFNTTLNLIPLKNSVSPENNIIRGDYMQSGTENTPDVDFREYTTINTGSNQEFGNSNIILNYIFYDREYTIKPGEDLIFTLRTDDNSLTGELSNSLYPFINLNINDTKFIKNGSLGSSSPFLADKFKKMQKDSQFTNNGRYLYTWLYQSSKNPYGIWLDRYYYPNLESKEALLSGKVNFDPASFNDIIDKDYINDDNFLSYIENAPYFDKQSDLVLEPNTEYMYSRIGNEEIISVLNEIIVNKEYESKVLKTPIKIDNNNIKNSGMLDLNFDMYLSPDKKYGGQILGNSMTNGLSITNEENITPFLYTFDNILNDKEELIHSYVHLHNTNYDIIKTIDFKTLYLINEKITQLVLNLPFNDFAILTEKSIFIVSYDLMIKEKFDLSIIFGVYEIKKVYIDKNYLYFICTDSSISNRIVKINLEEIKQPHIIELCQFNTLSKLVKVVTDLASESFPVYYDDLTGIGNIRYITEDITNHRKIYVTINNPKYPLPHNLAVDTEVYIIDNKFNQDFWYYAPLFRTNDSTKLNSFFINSLYINNSDVYGLPYTLLANKPDNINLYGIREQYEDRYYQVENVNLIDYRNKLVDTGDDNIIFVAYTKIFNIAVDSNDNLAILKNQSSKLIDKAKTELMIFDKGKRFLKSFILGDTYEKLFALDVINEYNNGITKSSFSLLATKYDDISKITSYHSLLINDKLILSDIILPLTIDTNQVKTVNFNRILALGKNNLLKFTLNLPKNSLINDKFTYSYNLDSIIRGWYNIHIIIDLNNGIFKTFINDELLQIEESFIIDKYIYNLKNVFNYPFTVGSISYRNGLLLDEFLNLSNFNSHNLKIKNFSIYSKVLNEYERQALLLNDVSVLVITLPGGQQNNLDEIIRFFKYNPPDNTSNTVRINIKNSGITKLSDQQQLSLDILKKINEELACPLTIKEIKFI